ncbi:DUF4349 domain-containing protein [Microbacterium sp. CJ88]|uniref:DUF4349 domain-containing protein n=1 Tax=Microbacterium sp. CJ88 TaxID=3445672 RepID=UPI003F65827D
MNTPQTDASTAGLPDLADDRLDAIEGALFARIAEERAAGRRRRIRRGRVWAGVGAAAAIVVVAAVLAPTVARIVTPTAMEGSAVAPAQGPSDSGGTSGSSSSEIAPPADAKGGAATSPGAGTDASRQTIATGSATLVVDDVTTAVRAVADAADAVGGHVESSTIGGTGGATPAQGGPAVDVMPYPYPGPIAGSGWVSVRVPADRLGSVMDGLSALGEVTASSVSRQDVTDQTVDLRARIDAAQTSITRLTALMAQATSTADLIAAESALAERQATLESYQQQLAMLDSQVKMSTLSVSVLPRSIPVTADPAGFGDGLAAGWNGLIATLNGIVVALGFLIPWIVVAAVLGAIAWAIVRVVRRARRVRRAAEPD